MDASFHVKQPNCLQLPITYLWLHTSHNNYIPIFNIYYANTE